MVVGHTANEVVALCPLYGNIALASEVSQDGGSAFTAVAECLCVGCEL